MATLSIGRSDQNDIVLGDTTVSRQHAELETRKRGRYILRDLDSTYGTRIFRDGEWLDIIEVEVTDDTEVSLGEHRALIRDLVALATPAAGAAEGPAAVQAAEAPAPRASRPAPPGQGSAAPGGDGGMNKRTTMFILLGGGALLLVVIIAIVLVLVLDGGPNMANRSTASAPGAPSGDTTRGQFEAALVRSCSGRDRYSDQQCRCIARQMSSALSRDELAIFVALRQAGDDDAKKREIMERFGLSKVMAIGVRMTQVVKQVEQQCGVKLRR